MLVPVNFQNEYLRENPHIHYTLVDLPTRRSNLYSRKRTIKIHQIAKKENYLFMVMQSMDHEYEVPSCCT